MGSFIGVRVPRLIFFFSLLFFLLCGSFSLVFFFWWGLVAVCVDCFVLEIVAIEERAALPEKKSDDGGGGRIARGNVWEIIRIQRRPRQKLVFFYKSNNQLVFVRNVGNTSGGIGILFVCLLRKQKPFGCCSSRC